MHPKYTFNLTKLVFLLVTMSFLVSSCSNSNNTIPQKMKAVDAGELQWIKQFDAGSPEYYPRISLDSMGNIYMAGDTYGNFAAENKGGEDVIIAKFDRNGILQWKDQIGTGKNDSKIQISTDSIGNSYITGHTKGALEGENAGSYDVFIAKYDSSGTQLWIRQFGTSKFDSPTGIGIDSAGNSYIVGNINDILAGENASSNDVFITKFGSDGTQLWIRQFDTGEFGSSSGISIDSKGNSYITGNTFGSLETANAGSSDVFITKYDRNGTQLWISQFGTSELDRSSSISIDDAGNQYITGTTTGSFSGENTGREAIFIAKYNSEGTQLWINQFGSDAHEVGTSISTTGAGDSYITGYTFGSLENKNIGSSDVFVAKYGSDGNQLWLHQFGTSSSEYGSDIIINSESYSYLIGTTNGDITGSSSASTNSNIFIAKFSP